MANKEQLEAEARRMGLSDSTAKRYVKVEGVRQREAAVEARKVEKQLTKGNVILCLKPLRKN